MSSHPFACIHHPALPEKPRSTGLTSILDKGLGPGQAQDLLASASEWIDVVKLGWGSARLTAVDSLREKMRLYKRANVRVCLGGTFLEIALAQGVVRDFMRSAKAFGADMLEVSNGVHPMGTDQKLELIGAAVGEGFTVWSEVGKKDPQEDARLSVDDKIVATENDLRAGAEKVVLEGRESGTVGIYNKDGEPASEMVERIRQRIGAERLVFEAPLKSQQLWMIQHVGATVNLANVPPFEAIPLATLRTGLRADTFSQTHSGSANEPQS